ncbi:MAG TPA: 30S ribosomal protein S12 methylthiotransferase RimO [Dongiaceae bacterium]|jgi:ribosomal protein S12 methylthiotransferase|nr:30S ribosomal protein S12 methylthiotransferase RimO [Dongiaceae bacterium]
MTKAAIPRVGLVSLGCAKALYDSERIVSHLRAEGYEFAPDYAGADMVIVNTCGFLESARAESLDAIGEAIDANGRVIVTGCLGAEPDVIRARYPKVFDITGPAHYEAVIDAVHRARPPLHDPHFDLLPPGGLKFTPRHYAYLKISEGCNNRCRFCIIPALRGDLVSRPASDVLEEAEALARAGVKELLVVSQDTSAYGIDLAYAESNWRGRPVPARILDLARALGSLGIWVRLHYIYPYPHVDGLIPLMAGGLILPYLDIPFQHASPRILKAMRRPANEMRMLDRIRAWRAQVLDLTLRSTFIVGFPGESEEDFRLLLDWLSEAELDRVGCFKYENVAGAAARELPGHISEDVKQERWDRLMAHQREISRRRLERWVGRSLRVLVDRADKTGIVARGMADAPEVDGVLHLPPRKGIRAGDFVTATVTGRDDYDLIGEIVANA